MIFKKVISTIIAADFAMGAIACGIQKAEERTLETMSAIEQQIEHHECPASVKTRNDNYVKDSLGAFSFTFYIPDDEWGYQTATGVRSQHLATCAVDPNVIPLGSTIMVTGDNGQTLVMKAVDIGNGIRGRKIDVFYDGTASQGYNWIAKFGTIHNVYLLEE